MRFAFVPLRHGSKGCDNSSLARRTATRRENLQQHVHQNVHRARVYSAFGVPCYVGASSIPYDPCMAMNAQRQPIMRVVRARTRVLLATALLAAVMLSGCERPRIASQVTTVSIRKISPGMSRIGVVSVLGQPLRERPGNGGGVILDYATPGAALHGTIWFWIALDSDGIVDAVHIERYPVVADNYAIYEARRDTPVYERPDLAKIVDGAQ